MLILGLVVVWISIPRAMATAHFPSDPLVRSHCEARLNENSRILPGVQISKAPGDDFVEITAIGYNRDEAKRRRDAAITVLHDMAREVEEQAESEFMDRQEKALSGQPPDERFRKLSEAKLKWGFTLQPCWIIRSQSESGW